MISMRQLTPAVCRFSFVACLARPMPARASAAAMRAPSHAARVSNTPQTQFLPQPPTPPSLTDRITIDPSSITARKGFAFQASLPLPVNQGGDLEHPHRSQWLLYEDGILLPYPNSLHADIENNGQGRYSHWGNTLVFSASDNSDPRSSHKSYELIRGPGSLTAGGSSDRPVISPLLPLQSHLLRPGETLGIQFDAITGRYRPAFGGDRACVNPDQVYENSFGVSFAAPGEYYLDTRIGPFALLILDPNPDTAEQQIVWFASANVSGGSSDIPDNLHDAPSWDHFDNVMLDKAFRSHQPLDVNCGMVSRLSMMLLNEAHLPGRYFFWRGNHPDRPAHIGIEVRQQDGRWVYLDPHFGTIIDDPHDNVDEALSGLDADLMLNRSPQVTLNDFHFIIDKGPWVKTLIAPEFDSIRACIWLDLTTADQRQLHFLYSPDRAANIFIDHAVRPFALMSGPEGAGVFRYLFYPASHTDPIITQSPPAREPLPPAIPTAPVQSGSTDAPPAGSTTAVMPLLYLRGSSFRRASPSIGP